jgi:hypothetical protein
MCPNVSVVVKTLIDNYYWRLTRQVFRECFSWSRQQIMPLLIAIIAAWLTLHFKLTPLAESGVVYKRLYTDSP